MKKYLMTGMATLAICAAFTSCSKETNVYNPDVIQENEAAKVQQSYADAFIATFGQPAANHQWGFINYKTAGTRAISDFSVGANKQRNMWAAIDGYNLLVPTPLSDGQKLRVRAYFQAHPGLTWETPTMTNYFVQQVYKGAYETRGANSDEQYPQGNGNIVVGSEHMDQLTVGASNEHVLDFNDGDNPNTAKDVLNNGETKNGQNFHSDQITLIVGIQPTCVGLESTDGSIHRNDCMALASAKDIDDWAIENEAELTAAGLFGKNVWYGKDDEGYENSSWNRSFVGLDYEQKTLEECYARDWQTQAQLYVKVDDSQGSYIYLGKDEDDKDIIISKTNYKAQYNDEYLRDLNGNLIPYVTDQTNQICGTNIDFSSQDAYQPRMDCTSAGGSNNDQVLDMTAIQGKLDQNAYPAYNGGLQKWIKDIGGRDYVYSDWIVTLTPARENTPEWNLRIICEDLNATATAEDPDDSDWDFNDLVLDVKFLGSDKVKMRVYAAGATLPIRINGEEALEVHGLFGQTTDKMINTGAAAAGYPNQAYESNGVYPEFERTIPGVDDAYGANIKIEVEKGAGNWVELFAKPGQPASKMGVLPDFTPCSERQDIKGRYSNFVAWINTQTPVYWWRPASNN